ncbi:GntP family permease [Methanosarcina sp. MSH10X1]|nr:GntP family permease [Methanosarcina sp. MSH10X1]
MHPVFIFLFALILILFFTARLRLHPFLSLVLVSVFTGALAGEPLATVEAITEGLGSVFSRFAIIITCGSVIGILLQSTGGMSLIASDIIRFFKNPLLALNLIGFLCSVPLMCYILAYVIFIPIAKELAARLDNPSISTATALALGAVASFNLVYPSPVIISAAEELSASEDRLFILGFLIAIPVSVTGYLYARRLGMTGSETTRTVKKKVEIGNENIKIYKTTAEEPGRLEAYSPIFFPLLLIFFQAGFEHSYPVLEFLGDPNIALLTGVILSISSGRRLGFSVLSELIEKAVRRSGVVLLDLCGGGALGATLAMTGAGEALGQLFLQLSLPHILIPFLVAAALQTVQGSRVVTMLIAPSLILPLVPELGLPPEILILSMASGTFVFSHVNDPFFWIFGELAELEPSEVFRSNTLGNALMGAVSLLLVSAAYVLFY